MRPLLTAVGAILFSLGLAGLVVMGIGPRHSVQLEVTRLAMRVGLITVPPPQLLSPLSVEEVRELTQLTGVSPSPASAGSETPLETAGAAPRRLRLPRIGLDSEIVPARLVRLASGPDPSQGAVTWEVPAHRVGHAQGTAAAGARGNTVLLGHVSSVNAGNVFADLGRVQVGDDITLEGGGSFSYRVTEVRRVARDDLSVMAPTEGAVLTLITCTGSWLPDALDYSHRLTVRATLTS